MHSYKRWSMGLVLPGALLLAEGALAQQAPPATTNNTLSDALEEVTVTASRREESASKVPISLTAFTQKTLDENNVRSVDDIAKMTPGVQFTRNSDYSGAVANISIRGVASDAGSGATGVYIDDTPIQNRASFSGLGSSVWPQIFDLERVEVLRGPQGTLFGAGSEGGTVRFITPQPSTTKFDVYARSDLAFTKGGDPSQEIGAAVNVPLIDGVLGVRASASYRHDGGYVNRVDWATGNVEQPGSNFDNISTMHIAMAYNATDDLTITPSFYWQKIYINDSSAYWEPLSNPGSDSFNRGSLIRNTTTDTFTLPALKAEWRMPFATLTSNTSYYQRQQPSVQDLAFFESGLWAGNPIPPAGMYAPSYDQTKQRNFTQEVRLASKDADARVVWLVGLFYQNNWQHVSQNVQDTFFPGLIQKYHGVSMDDFFGLPPGTGLLDGLYTVVINPFDTVDKQLAAFGQVDVKITDSLKATVGLRRSHQSFSDHVVYAGPVFGAPVEGNNSAASNPVTPKYGLSYQVNDGTMVYTSVGKGYRMGGGNNPVAASCATDLGNVGLTSVPTLFKDDSLWSYELGSKWRGLNGHLAVDASVYLIKWSDIQFSYTLPICGFSVTTNAGNATSRGFELSVQSRPLDNWDLGVAFGYVHATYDNTAFFNGAQTLEGEKSIVGSGDRIPVAPWTIAVQSQWNFTAFQYDSYFRVNYNYADGLNTNLPVQDSRTGGYDPDIPGLPVLNDLSLKLGAHFGPADVALYVNNAVNIHPNLGVTHAVAGDSLFLNVTERPRTIGITATYRY